MSCDLDKAKIEIVRDAFKDVQDTIRAQDRKAYPDISNEQVFEIGSHDIEVVHFRGATGLAYQKLYEAIFSYKDELKALNKKETKV